MCALCAPDNVIGPVQIGIDLKILFALKEKEKQINKKINRNTW